MYAGAVTTIALLITYPMTYWIAFYAGRWKASLLFLILAPFFVSFIIRTVQWGFLLADNGVILGPLKHLGLLPDGFQILGDAGRGHHGHRVQLPSFHGSPALRRARPDRQGARGRRQGPVRESMAGVPAGGAPSLVPGIFAAIVLTFVPATGDYINAEVLGGPGTTMVGNVIQSKFLVEGDYPEAAALSVVLMVVMLVLALIYARMLGTDDPSTELVPALRTTAPSTGRKRWTRF